MKVGDLDVVPVIDGRGREQAREVLSAPGDDRWACRPDRLDAHGNLEPTVDDAGAVRELSPLRERLETFDAEHTVAPGFDARPTPDHTPGSTSYVISSRGERALLVGGVAHSVVELEEPDRQATFDVRPAAAQATRNHLVDDLADSEELVPTAHLPGLAFGRMVTFDDHRRFVAV